MEKPELLEFFRENTKDLPRKTKDWLQLPNNMVSALKKLEPGELRRMLQAGKDLRTILGIPVPKVSEAFKQFLDTFVPEINSFMTGREVEAIGYTTAYLERTQGQFSVPQDELTLVRKKILEARAIAQGHLTESGLLSPLPYGHKLRSLCLLSEAADWMGTDLETGQVTGRGDRISECFGQSQMELLQRKVVEKLAGEKVEIVYQDTLRPIRRFSTPYDPEIRKIQRLILAELIPALS